MLNVDLNCDLGESTLLGSHSAEKDLLLLPYLSSINIACGFHAGDPDTAAQLIRSAAPQNIAIGAHPSFPDRDNFGRKDMHLEDKELFGIIFRQLEYLGSIAIANGARIHHVKPHGALYNMAAKDHRLAFIICSAVQAYDEELIVYGLSGSEIIRVADTMGMRSCSEVFADRRYDETGTVVSRTNSNALINDEKESLEQVLGMLFHGKVQSVDGTAVPVLAETICIHGDGMHAMQFAKTIYDTLHEHGIGIFHP